MSGGRTPNPLASPEFKVPTSASRGLLSIDKSFKVEGGQLKRPLGDGGKEMLAKRALTATPRSVSGQDPSPTSRQAVPVGATALPARRAQPARPRRAARTCQKPPPPPPRHARTPPTAPRSPFLPSGAAASPFPTTLGGAATPMEATAPSSAMLPASQRLHHLTSMGGAGISPFAAFAETLTPLADAHAGSASLSARLGPLASCSLRVGDRHMLDTPAGAAGGAGVGAGSAASFSVQPQETVVALGDAGPSSRGRSSELRAAADRSGGPSSTGVTRGHEENFGGNEAAAGVALSAAAEASLEAKRKGPRRLEGSLASGAKSKGKERAGGAGSSLAVSTALAGYGEQASTPGSEAWGEQGASFDQLIAGIEAGNADGTVSISALFSDGALPTGSASGGPGLFSDTGLPIERPEKAPSAAALKPSKSRGGRPKKCNCKNSRCLKLYCDCFSASILCDDCNCNDCKNNKENEEEKDNARKAVLKRNPRAFHAKFEKEAEAEAEADEATGAGGAASTKHARGCCCSKSRCIKNYCECWQMGIKCHAKCKCVDCMNGKDGGAGAPDAASQAEGAAVPAALKVLTPLEGGGLDSAFDLPAALGVAAMGGGSGDDEVFGQMLLCLEPPVAADDSTGVGGLSVPRHPAATGLKPAAAAATGGSATKGVSAAKGGPAASPADVGATGLGIATGLAMSFVDPID